MVHALEKAYRLLKPDGMLIDIHPAGEPPPIHVRVGDKHYLAGWIEEEDDYEEYEQADAALAQVVAGGRFAQERQDTFSFVTYADSLPELQQYLADEWHDAIIDDRVALRIAQLMSTVEPDKEIIVREIIRITRLRPRP